MRVLIGILFKGASDRQGRDREVREIDVELSKQYRSWINLHLILLIRDLISSGVGLVLEKGPKIVKLPKPSTASDISADTTAALEEVVAAKAKGGDVIIDSPPTPATPDII